MYIFQGEFTKREKKSEKKSKRNVGKKFRKKNRKTKSEKMFGSFFRKILNFVSFSYNNFTALRQEAKLFILGKHFRLCFEDSKISLPQACGMNPRPKLLRLGRKTKSLDKISVM